jgi:hypothetical protein
MKNKMKYVVIAVLILGVCSVGAHANGYWYNTTPCEAIDISLDDSRVIDFLDHTNGATVDVYNCEYKGYDTWMVCWYTKTQSQKVYISIYGGRIIGTGPEPEPCWHTVTTIQGRHDKETPAFNIKGDTWRMDWKTVGHENESSISVTVYKDLGFFTFIDGFSGNNYPFSDTYCVYNGAGTYYLDIQAEKLDLWKITVQDYY